jgi:hypothetical protein
MAKYSNNINKFFSVVTLVSAISLLNISVTAQDTTYTSLDVDAGQQTIYAGDSIDNNDICSPANIANLDTVEGVSCTSAENSITLPTIAIQAVRQNPSTLLNDVLVEDLRGFATSNYTVTAEVSDFTTGTNDIILGSNPDNTAAALDAGEVTSIEVTAGGTGYTAGTVTVTLTGGGGTGATAEATVTSGAVTAITVTDPGTGFTSTPTVTITDSGTGAGATATAYIIAEDSNVSAGTVNSVNVTDGGTSGCTAVSVAFTGGGGSGATADVTLGSGVITAITVTNPGSGYTAAPTVVFTEDCTGTPTATALVTAAGTGEAGIFATVDPSIGNFQRLLPDSNATNFSVGPRSLATNNSAQYTLYSTSAPVAPGRFDVDSIGFGIRVPAFVGSGTYTGTITQTVIN